MGIIMIKKRLIASVLILALVACMFSGCLGDKIVGTWKSTDSNATITFNKDKTFTASIGLLGNLNGTWEKSGDEYILSSTSGSKLGSAVFVNKNIRITVGGIIPITGEFAKQK